MSLGKKTEQEKTLDILLLHRQLATLERKLDKPLRGSRAEKRGPHASCRGRAGSSV
jgi:hypothetical protein